MNLNYVLVVTQLLTLKFANVNNMRFIHVNVCLTAIYSFH